MKWKYLREDRRGEGRKGEWTIDREKGRKLRLGDEERAGKGEGRQGDRGMEEGKVSARNPLELKFSNVYFKNVCRGGPSSPCFKGEGNVKEGERTGGHGSGEDIPMYTFKIVRSRKTFLRD